MDYSTTKRGEEMRPTNTMFAKDDKIFQEACRLAVIEPTPRQASKWRNGKGLARKFKGQVGVIETPSNVPRI